MFSSLLRGNRPSRKESRTGRGFSPHVSSPEASRHRHVGQSVDDDDGVDDDDDEEDEDEPALFYNTRGGPSYFDRRPRRNDERDEDEDQEEDEDEDAHEDHGEDAINTPLLPIFSAAHLDRLPLYNITHAIRILIVQKCETTLSWDQLRSPQISQFVVKSVQTQIRTNHFNRATLCALIANCLQFQKEGQMNPGNVGVSQTRALISELLAMRLLKEMSTRELIDALSYDVRI